MFRFIFPINHGCMDYNIQAETLQKAYEIFKYNYWNDEECMGEVSVFHKSRLVGYLTKKDIKGCNYSTVVLHPILTIHN